MKKRILAIVMSVIMTIGLLPETNYAQEVNSAVTPATSTEASTSVATPENGSEAKYTYETGLMHLQGEEIQITDADVAACGVVDSTGIRVASEWDKYESNYYYNQMSDREKAFYNSLDLVCYSYLTTPNDIVGARTGYSNYIDGSDLTWDQIVSIYEIFKYSNPQYFFIDSSYLRATVGGYGKYFAIGIYQNFLSGANRSAATSNLKSTADGMVASIVAQGDKLAMEKKAHDLIVGKVSYDSNYIDHSQNDSSDDFDTWFAQYEQTAYTQSCYSTFCGSNNMTVCAGYALAFEMLCNAAGIDTIAVLSQTHAWNMVRQNGRWYYVDCTWDDQSGTYMFFNRDLKNLKALDQNSAHNAEGYLTSFGSNQLNLIPNSGMDSNPKDYYSIGTIASALGTATVPTISVDASGILTIASGQAGAKFYYTVDGTKPSVSITKCNAYSAPVKITQTANVQAIASYDGYNDSSIVGAGFSTVTFNSKGGTAVASQSVATGGLAVKPAKPSKSGYTFLGWYKDAGLTSEWNFGTDTVTGNVTLYAKWGKTYKIHYNLNNGKQNKSNPTKYTPLTNTFALKNPTRKGYKFGGWYRNSNLTAKVTKVKKGTKGNLTFYAKWVKVSVAQGTLGSVKNKAGKKMNVSFAKVGGAAGYQVQYSTKANMKSAKMIRTTKTSTLITNLKKKKTYYVQVRVYKLDSAGNKVYGAWSGIKSVKIKK